MAVDPPDSVLHNRAQGWVGGEGVLMYRPVMLSISSPQDIAVGRTKGRELAARIGFSAKDQIAIAAAISDLSHNILGHAERGEILLTTVHGESGELRGIQAVARATGPQVPRPDDYTPPGAQPGLRLTSMKRVMDEFEVQTDVPQGLTVTIRKWLK